MCSRTHSFTQTYLFTQAKHTKSVQQQIWRDLRGPRIQQVLRDESGVDEVSEYFVADLNLTNGLVDHPLATIDFQDDALMPGL